MIDQPRVDPSNDEQWRAWDGDEGAYWAAHADEFDDGVQDYQEAFIAAAGIASNDRVLDVGCGAGRCTLDAARLAAGGHALGVDLSAALLDVARRRAAEARLANAAFMQADAQIHPFAPGTFDVAISRTAAMFFGDPEAAFGNIAQALRPGGRLALLVWQGPEHNEWITAVGAALAAGRERPAPVVGQRGPFALAEPARMHALLGATGFADIEVAGQTGTMYFGPTVDAAFDLVAGLMAWLVAGLDEHGRAVALAALRSEMHAHAGADGVRFGSAVWQVTARRR